MVAAAREIPVAHHRRLARLLGHERAKQRRRRKLRRHLHDARRARPAGLRLLDTLVLRKKRAIERHRRIRRPRPRRHVSDSPGALGRVRRVHPRIPALSGAFMEADPLVARILHEFHGEPRDERPGVVLRKDAVWIRAHDTRRVGDGAQGRSLGEHNRRVLTGAQRRCFRRNAL